MHVCSLFRDSVCVWLMHADLPSVHWHTISDAMTCRSMNAVYWLYLICISSSFSLIICHPLFSIYFKYTVPCRASQEPWQHVIMTTLLTKPEKVNKRVNKNFIYFNGCKYISKQTDILFRWMSLYYLHSYEARFMWPSHHILIWHHSLSRCVVMEGVFVVVVVLLLLFFWVKSVEDKLKAAYWFKHNNVKSLSGYNLPKIGVFIQKCFAGLCGK